MPEKRRTASGDSQPSKTSETPIETSFDETESPQTHHDLSLTEGNVSVSPTTRALSLGIESVSPDQMLHDLMPDVVVQHANTSLHEPESQYRFTADSLDTFDPESACSNLNEHVNEAIDIEDSSK